jgi:hypothetical protein
MSVTNTTTKTEIDEAEYLVAVKEGKAICATMSGKQWALGDLAAQVIKVYGENRLERFAEDINFPGAACTLGRYRPVCLAFPKTGPRPTFFASAKVLQKHPDRIRIVTETPDISAHGARKLMSKLRAEQPQADQADDDQADEDPFEEGEEDGENTEPTATIEEDDTAATSQANTSTAATAKGAKAKRAAKEKQQQEQEDEWLRDNRRWFRDLVAAANEASRVAGMMDLDDEEQLNKLLPAVNPGSLMYVRGAGRMLFRVANRLAELLEVDLEESAPIDRAHPAASAQTAA